MKYFSLDALLLHSAMDSSRYAEYRTLPRNHGLNGSYMRTEMLTSLISYPFPCTPFSAHSLHSLGGTCSLKQPFPLLVTWPLIAPSASFYDMRDRLWATIGAPCSNQSYLSIKWLFVLPPPRPNRSSSKSAAICSPYNNDVEDRPIERHV